MSANKIPDEALADVTGGWGTIWTDEDEKNLRNEFLAANPDILNPTSSDLDMFSEAKGLRERIDDGLVYATIIARVHYQTCNGA